MLHRAFLPMLAMLLSASAATAAVEFAERPGQVVITADGRPLATYVYQDEEISRPHFAHVHAPGGTQVTRNHPPIEGRDLTDHATFHPGLWLSFGDISGEDFWRLKAPVKHVRFVAAPQQSGDAGTFTVENAYCRADDPTVVVCRQICTYTFRPVENGVLIVDDSAFFSRDRDFYFGDQEEMGLGIRMATPLSVKSGGRILDADGRVNEKQVWGKSSAWCDYSGVIDGRRLGILIMPDPGNFRPSRYHARDYGMLTANPFGQKVFGAETESRVPVTAGTPLRLRYGVILHSTPADRDFDCPAAYREFVGALSALPRPSTNGEATKATRAG